MSLLQETIDDLKQNDKTPADVRWVGVRSWRGEGWWSWEDFAQIADVDYDSEYGGQEVNDRLIVCGDDWWLERHECEGSEWWEFKSLPTRPGQLCAPNQAAIVSRNWSYGDKSVCLEG